ncbi:glycosyltransferase family 4 protein [Terasakiella sp. SH-1]|uniref:glycosyltransferase family 4 protein n=1 Tax=Terasakiella sp. SH-1 TaxID=2560057 RepID=UPI001074662D|nr:glycosyltransferase family 4 protein [Terasakiella sp. SH-1]
MKNLYKDSVVFVLADMGGGGAQNVSHNVMNYWAANGKNVALITMAPVSEDKFPIHPAITRHVIGGIIPSTNLISRLFNNIKRIIQLRKVLKLYSGYTILSFIAPMNILTILATVGFKCRRVISERNDPAKQSFGKFWDYLRTKLYPCADVVTANSQGALETLSSYVPYSKLGYLPNPLRHSFPHHPVSRDQKIILTVGRLHQQKAHDVLIRAFSHVADKKEDWHLMIVGEGPEREMLTELISQLRLETRITLCGFQENVTEYYKKASIFALPSRYEGTPNVLLEALSYGIPSIASDAIPSIESLIEDKVSGAIIPCNNEREWAFTLLRFIENHNKLDGMAFQARQTAQRYTLDNVIHDWNKYIFPDSFR